MWPLPHLSCIRRAFIPWCPDSIYFVLAFHPVKVISLSTSSYYLPGFSAPSNLVPSCVRRRRYIPTQHFRSQMPRGGSKTILHGFPKHLTYSKLSTCYHHQSLENDHAWPSISISETSQGILSLFLGRPQPFIFKPPRCAKSSGNRRFLLL